MCEYCQSRSCTKFKEARKTLFKASVIGERDQNSVCAQIYSKKKNKKDCRLLRSRVGGCSVLLCSQCSGKVSLVTASKEAFPSWRWLLSQPGTHPSTEMELDVLSFLVVTFHRDGLRVTEAFPGS